jgi:hypothetical protein
MNVAMLTKHSVGKRSLIELDQVKVQWRTFVMNFWALPYKVTIRKPTDLQAA